MTVSKIITKKYKGNKAYIKIKGAIINPETVRQVPFNCECLIDTGFGGGIMIPYWHKDELEPIEVEPRPTNITLADGSVVPALVCVAHIQEIDSSSFPMPGRPVTLFMCGNWPGELLGMDALKYSTVLFDGPKQTCTMNP